MMTKNLKKLYATNILQKIFNLVFYKSISSSKKKSRVLKSIYGDLKIKDLPKDKDFFIITTDFKRGIPVVMENVSGKWDDNYLWEVANYTSDAPFYFNNFKSPYIDGGIYANDPRTILMQLEDEKLIKAKIKNFLSIGFDGKPKVLTNQELRSSWLKKFPRLLDMLINLDAKVNDKWFKSGIAKNPLRIVFDTKGQIIPTSEINPHLIALATKNAKRVETKIKEFIENL